MLRGWTLYNIIRETGYILDENISCKLHFQSHFSRVVQVMTLAYRHYPAALVCITVEPHTGCARVRPRLKHNTDEHHIFSGWFVRVAAQLGLRKVIRGAGRDARIKPSELEAQKEITAWTLSVPVHGGLDYDLVFLPKFLS